jgi:hypothetical protein
VAGRFGPLDAENLALIDAAVAGLGEPAGG